MPLVSKSFSDIITFTRASSGTYFDATGTLQTATTNNARFDYDPSTLAARGMLVEEQRTNGIRNNTMVGAVAGSPGTLPTNWAVNTVSGITVSVSSVSAENGITYVDLNFSGTAGATANQFVAFDTIGGIAAANAQTWTHSIYIKQVTSVALPTVSVSWRTYDSLSLLVTATGASATVADNSANLRTARQAYSATLSGATIASIRPTVEISLVSGTAYNFTLRIGLPQLEQGAFATSVISTSTAAATRSADVASVNTLSPWYNASAGTLFAETEFPYSIPSGQFPNIAGLNDGSLNNRIIFFAYQSGGNKSNFTGTQSGVQQWALDSAGTVNSVNTRFKLAGAYRINDIAFTDDAITPLTDISATIPTVTTLDIGKAIASNHINGYIRRITYYPRRLSNAELQGITT